MKNLVDIMKFVSKDTIYEKLDINKVSLNEDLEFPIDGKPSDVFLWLKKNKFKQFDCNDEHIKTQFNNKNARCFATQQRKSLTYSNQQTVFIWFADTSKKKISEDNPIFLYKIDGKLITYYFIWKEMLNPKVGAFEFTEKINETLK